MTRLYDYLGTHTKFSQETRIRLCLYAGILFWTAVGTVLGLLLSLGLACFRSSLLQTGAPQSISPRFVISAGSLFGVIFGYIVNLLRLYNHG